MNLINLQVNRADWLFVDQGSILAFFCLGPPDVLALAFGEAFLFRFCFGFCFAVGFVCHRWISLFCHRE